MIRAILKKRKKAKLRNNKIAEMLNDIADTVVGQIKTDVKKGKDIHGQPFEPLKRLTIKAKKKKGSKTPNKPLMDTGLMRKIFRSKSASASNLESIVDVAKKRNKVAEYHNFGKGNLPERVWFGIGDKTKRRLNKMIRAKIKKIVRFVK